MAMKFEAPARVPRPDKPEKPTLRIIEGGKGAKKPERWDINELAQTEKFKRPISESLEGGSGAERAKHREALRNKMTQEKNLLKGYAQELETQLEKVIDYINESEATPGTAPSSETSPLQAPERITQADVERHAADVERQKVSMRNVMSELITARNQIRAQTALIEFKQKESELEEQLEKVIDYINESEATPADAASSEESPLRAPELVRQADVERHAADVEMQKASMRNMTQELQALRKNIKQAELGLKRTDIEGVLGKAKLTMEMMGDLTLEQPRAKQEINLPKPRVAETIPTLDESDFELEEEEPRMDQAA